jgi:hypothetical protein
MGFHILITPSIARPWWPTDERFSRPSDEKVWTDCCACKVPASDTISRIVDSWDIPINGDMGCYQEHPCPVDKLVDGKWAEPYFPTGAYYGPNIETRCAPGCGCSANPRKKFGASLRAMMRDGW